MPDLAAKERHRSASLRAWSPILWQAQESTIANAAADQTTLDLHGTLLQFWINLGAPAASDTLLLPRLWQASHREFRGPPCSCFKQGLGKPAIELQRRARPQTLGQVLSSALHRTAQDATDQPQNFSSTTRSDMRASRDSSKLRGDLPDSKHRPCTAPAHCPFVACPHDSPNQRFSYKHPRPRLTMPLPKVRSTWNVSGPRPKQRWQCPGATMGCLCIQVAQHTPRPHPKLIKTPRNQKLQGVAQPDSGLTWTHWTAQRKPQVADWWTCGLALPVSKSSFTLSSASVLSRPWPQSE